MRVCKKKMCPFDNAMGQEANSGYAYEWGGSHLHQQGQMARVIHQDLTRWRNRYTTKISTLFYKQLWETKVIEPETMKTSIGCTGKFIVKDVKKARHLEIMPDDRGLKTIFRRRQTPPLSSIGKQKYVMTKIWYLIRLFCYALNKRWINIKIAYKSPIHCLLKELHMIPEMK